jgi:hypothetical protein
MLGKDLIIYFSQFGNYTPIGCAESCTVTINAEEIITTTKGSGRATNREYGSYDWQVQCNSVVLNTVNSSAEIFISPIVQGIKVLIKAQLGNVSGSAHQSTLFGRGIVTSVEITGAAEGYGTAAVTIKADGPLYLPADLQNTFFAPGYYELLTTGSTTTISTADLLNKSVAWVVVDNIVLPPEDYEYMASNGYGAGVLTFNDPVATGKLIQVFFQV